MAQLDPSIPLSVAKPPTPLESLSQAAQAGEQIQNIQAQRALREAYAGADTSTPEGQQTLIRKVGAASPEAAMKLQTQFATQAKTKAETRRAEAGAAKSELEMYLKKIEVLDDAGSALMYKFTDLTQNKGMAPQDAAALITADIPVIKAHLAAQRLPDGSPVMSQEQIDGIPNQFDPQKFGTAVMNAKGIRQNLDYQLNIQKERRYEAAQVSTERHQRVLEGQGQQRLGMERARLGLERRRLEEQINTPKSDIGKIEADYKTGRISKEDRDAGLAKKVGTQDPATEEAMADLIGTRKIAAPTGAALRNPSMARVMARVAEKYPDFDAKDFASESKAIKDFSTGKQGNTVRSLNVSISHLDTLDQLSKALHNKDLQAVNRLGNKVAELTGNPAPTNFDAAKKIVADEIVKGIVGSGGGVHDREEAARVIASANSPAQLAGIIKTYKELLGGQLKGLRQQYEETTGRKDFERFIKEGTRRELEGGKKTPSSAQAKAPDAAISHLKAHPELKEQFKAKYGYLPD